MAQYRLEHRGKRIVVIDDIDPASGAIVCSVMIEDMLYEHIRGGPFRNVHAAQTTGAAFARTIIDAELDGDVLEHRGYFIRATSAEQRDGSWVATYQLHRNANPVPFRRVTCSDFHGNSPLEAEENAIKMAQAAIDQDVKAGTL